MLTAQRSPARYSQRLPDSGTESNSGPAPGDCSIYVVDDDPVIANLVFHNLRSSGYQVAQFATGSEMLDSIESEWTGEAKWPDLVVLDIMMPGPNGLEIARNLRGFSQIPILMLSIRDETDTKLAALDLNQSQSGIYMYTGLGSAAKTVIPANAGIQGTVQNMLSWTPA